MRGREKCRILKKIREKIAQENDIEYVTRECGFQGECRGTCPKCESELRYLEKQLEARQAAGRRIAIVALCAGMSLGMAGCTHSMRGADAGGSELSGDVEVVEQQPGAETGGRADVENGSGYDELSGFMIAPDTVK